MIDTVADWVRAAGPAGVTALVGAGMSTDSGIPDFRGPNGVWTTNPAAQALVTIDAYVAERSVRVRAWRERRTHPAWTARPNAGHAALVDLERAGLLNAVVTQNIDGLHQQAGAQRVLEIHGTIWRAVCLSCGDRQPMRDVLDRVDAGEEDPPCLHCGGILKSDTISFGQTLDPVVLAESARAARDCSLLVAIGTSLQVQPAAGLCDVAVRSGARLVVVNAQPTPYDAIADAVVRDPIGEVLPAIVAAAVGQRSPGL
jgi:NAD-dependent deacetylase